MEFNEIKKPVLDIVSNKKYQWIATIVVLLVVLFLSVNIRIQPVTNGNLIDVSTGDYVPLALDPYYFLRISETLIENDGVLPEFDKMHYQALNATWSPEILPMSTVFLWKIMRMFNSNVTLNFVNILNPVVFFILGIIVFFILAWIITKNKWIAIIASFILSIIPPYLYRTLAGFSDHEAIGMFGFFLSLLIFIFGMFYLEKKPSGIKLGLVGLASGFVTMFAISAWGGGAKFLFMILPAAFLIRWFTKNDKSAWNYIIFYGLFIFGVLLSVPLFGFDLNYVLDTYMLSSTGLLTLFAFGYCLIETVILEIRCIPVLLKNNSKLAAIISVILFGGLIYQIFVGSFFNLVYDLVLKLLYPFGTERVGLTVAENKQPYLTELVSQVGKVIFYTFLFGCFIAGGKLASGIKKRKLRYLFTGAFAFFVVGILFSKFSPSSVLSGENFLSKFLFFVSFLFLMISSIYIYKNSEWKIDMRWIFIISWMIPMLLAVRSAIRVFFAIVPFISLMVPIVLFEVFKFGRCNKDDLIKLVSFILVAVVSIALLFSLFGYYKVVNEQARYQSPSYNIDWQKAMNWTRSNTPEGSVFLHWWDYGYWVQTGGRRPTVTDGGHFNGYWDHLIGRYVLTTPYPETAKSFMLAHNVSYLLIDPTDIGKYGAYSIIGDDEEVSDRASYIPTMISDPSETTETQNGTRRLYRGGMPLDDDIIYDIDGKKTFLPRGNVFIGAVTINNDNVRVGNTTASIPRQPEGIYIYNNQQYNFPIRYLYWNNRLIDFETGINATVYIYPNVYTSSAGQQIDQEGAVMYLSEKVKDSLVAKLYLMNDPDNEYPELELLLEQSEYPFAFNYGGYRGPIKIYKVHNEEMGNIIARDEFTEVNGGYGELDNLEFVK